MEEERKQATVITARGKNAERDHKDDPKPQHAESEDQRRKIRGSKLWKHRKANPTKEANARRSRKAGGGESTRRGEKERQLRTGSQCRRKETEPEETGTSPKGILEDTGQIPGNNGREKRNKPEKAEDTRTKRGT